MLTIKNKKIYSDKGDFLKTIGCPKKVSYSALIRNTAKNMRCCRCNKNVIDTDKIDEEELVNILTKDKDTCLVINRLNPMFDFYKNKS